jgi:predicted site-specific integrase-resolvase
VHEELLRAIQDLEQQVKQVKAMAEKAMPQSEWLTSHEFAEQTGLKPKTVSNYAGKGRFRKIKKNSHGQYIIHRDELQPWTNQ